MNLNIGSDKPKSISELMRETGLSNRDVRRELERMAKDGVFIGNMQDGKGYFIFDLPRESELAERYLKQEMSRATKILARVSKLDGYLTALNDGNLYRIERKKRSLTQRKVAKATGLEVAAISQIERGKRKPTLLEKIKLNGFYGVNEVE